MCNKAMKWEFCQFQDKLRNKQGVIIYRIGFNPSIIYFISSRYTYLTNACICKPRKQNLYEKSSKYRDIPAQELASPADVVYGDGPKITT